MFNVLTAHVTGGSAGSEQIFPAGHEKHSVEASGEYCNKNSQSF